jgi:hypothetical protein
MALFAANSIRRERMSVRGTSRHFAAMQNVFATGLSKIESETIFVALTPTGNEPWRARQLFT